MENIHRHFIQYLMRNGAVTTDQAMSFCGKLNREINTLSDLKNLITTINTEIKKQDFTIVIRKCEITEHEQVLWLNLKNDDISHLQSIYTITELEYFHQILQTILSSDHYRIKETTCLNLASSLTGRLQRNQAEDVLNKWINGRYFIMKDCYIYLGKRLIEEFQTYLTTHLQNCKCGLCSEMTFYGKMCDACGRLFHNYCIDGYLQKYQICPNCDNEWSEAEYIPSQFVNSQETTMENE